MLMAKRDIFGELMEGAAAMKSHREGKLTLRSYKVAAAPLPKVDSKLIRDTRKRLHCSRAVFARKLRINERTFGSGSIGRVRIINSTLFPTDASSSSTADTSSLLAPHAARCPGRVRTDSYSSIKGTDKSNANR